MLSLALSTGISLIELRDGNCFEPIRGIVVGEVLLVPQLPKLPVAAPAPEFPTDGAVGAVLGCDSRRAQIISPAPLDLVEDVFAIIGSALLPEGGRYRIALKPGWSEEFYPYLISHQAVHSDVLGLVNSEIFGPGAQQIQLTVIDRDGELIEGGLCEVPVSFGAP